MTRLVILVIRAYQLLLSPLLGPVVPIRTVLLAVRDRMPGESRRRSGRMALLSDASCGAIRGMQAATIHRRCPGTDTTIASY